MLKLLYLAMLLCALPSDAAKGQSPASSAPETGYTLHATARAVVTDVTVLDRNGNPVHDLPVSAFHVLDNNQPEQIASFEEHKTTPTTPWTPASLAHDVYSNDILQHLPPVLNIMVLDITNLQIPDQMYLSDQLQRFIDGLPVGELLAIYLHAGISSVLVQSFTSDHAQLLAAVYKSMPHLLPTGSEYLSDWNTLHQIAMDLSQVPGRKNILWFSGGSTFFLRPDASLMPVSGDMRRIYDELETGRIAVYPIDARGLTTSQGGNVWAQHQLMNDVAEATGGQASYNTNGIWQAAKHVTDSGHSFYTVTYSPHGFHYDNKWHKVRIGVEGAKYNLSYRRGYFGDGSHDDTPKGAARSRLLAEGKTALEQPEFRSAPIIFSAKVKAVVPFAERSAAVDLVPVKKGETRYSIWYSLPVAAFTRQTVSLQPQVMLGVDVLAMNRDGSRLASVTQKITVTVDEDKLRLAPDSPLPFVQTIDLRQGDVYLYLAVWDMVSRRLGTLQIPLHVPAAGAAHSTKETN